jgi:hypothetical protein
MKTFSIDFQEPVSIDSIEKANPADFNEEIKPVIENLEIGESVYVGLVNVKRIS